MEYGLAESHHRSVGTRVSGDDKNQVSVTSIWKSGKSANRSNVMLRTTCKPWQVRCSSVKDECIFCNSIIDHWKVVYEYTSSLITNVLAVSNILQEADPSVQRKQLFKIASTISRISSSLNSWMWVRFLVDRWRIAWNDWQKRPFYPCTRSTIAYQVSSDRKRRGA